MGEEKSRQVGRKVKKAPEKENASITLGVLFRLAGRRLAKQRAGEASAALGKLARKETSTVS